MRDAEDLVVAARPVAHADCARAMGERMKREHSDRRRSEQRGRRGNSRAGGAALQQLYAARKCLAYS